MTAVSDSQPFIPGRPSDRLGGRERDAGSNRRVHRLIKNGELPAVRVGKNYRLRETDLERFLDAPSGTEAP